ncbi:hypothetical protein H0E84_09020 [Luteimonas sp. SJ-92]|uniref:Uncharacterized protein n=1 Tax=Luteimonas salinisoli TaxID=2752307 RepID=A0A853JBA6_9GAMM|nr:hypothetical protein [Luteimonas salinisoli]NZA26526.1 hypothetical protein [Luteimonas salinisoli]
MITLKFLTTSFLLLGGWIHNAQASTTGTSPTDSIEARLATCRSAGPPDGASTLRTVAIRFHEISSEDQECRPPNLFATDATRRIKAGKALLEAANAVLLAPVLVACSGGGQLCEQAAYQHRAGAELDNQLNPRTLAMDVIPPRSSDALGRAIDTYGRPKPHPSPLAGADVLRDRIMVAAISDGCSATVGAKLDALLAGSLAPLDERELRENLNDSTASSSCIEAFDTAARIFLHAATLDAVHASTLAPAAFVKLAVDARINYAKWDAYNFGGGTSRVQLPWEIALNGALYRGNPRDGSAELWPEPPTSALILFHPTLGIAPFSTDGSASGVIGAIEAVGWSRWRYSSKNTRADDWGGSLAAVYVPGGESDGWHPGLVVRTPFRSVNIVYARTRDEASDDGHLVAFSVDVSRFVFRDKGVTGRLVCNFGLPACDR